MNSSILTITSSFAIIIFSRVEFLSRIAFSWSSLSLMLNCSNSTSTTACTGVDSNFASIFAISRDTSSTCLPIFLQSTSCFLSSSVADFISDSASALRKSLSIGPPFSKRYFILPSKSLDSSFAILNLASKISRSRNLARISFLFVEPSAIKARDSSCDDKEVIRKSSIEPKNFLMFSSVCERVSPFRGAFSSVARS